MKLWVGVLLVVPLLGCDKLARFRADAGSTSSSDAGTVAVADSASATAAADSTAAAPVTFEVGDKVQGKWSDGLWYNGKISAVNADHTYNIKYNDGDVANHLRADHVRVAKISTGGTTTTTTTTTHAGGGGSNASAPCPGPGLTRRCSGVCVNIQESNDNCGSCGNRCPSGKHCDGHMSCRDANGDL